MKQSKVESILNTREWSWPNWAVFYIQMKLENWETITLGKKSKDAYKEWDEVKYEAYTDANWKQKWKEVKRIHLLLRNLVQITQNELWYEWQ